MPKTQPKLLGSKHGYNLAAPFYDIKEKYLNSFEQDKIWPLLGNLTNKKILDVGAGTGRLSLKLKQHDAEVVALDISPQMLSEFNRKNKNIQTVVGEAESLPFPAETFDLVVAAFLIVHLKNPTIFFNEAHRVLKNEGKLLVTNINQRKPPEVKSRQGPIVIESYYHRPERVKDALHDLAFTVEKEIFVKQGGVWINQILLATK